MRRPIELSALSSVLGAGRDGNSPLFVGSAKTNIGHTESCAGVAGLIKTVLSLEHREIPPSLQFETPNPDVPWAELLVRIPVVRTPWPATGALPPRAGVSAFGISGT